MRELTLELLVGTSRGSRASDDYLREVLCTILNGISMILVLWQAPLFKAHAGCREGIVMAPSTVTTRGYIVLIV